MSIIFVGPESLILDRLDLTDSRYLESNKFSKLGRFYRYFTIKRGIIPLLDKIITTEDSINLTSSLRNYLYKSIQISIVCLNNTKTYSSDSDFFDQFDSTWLWLGKPKKYKLKKKLNTILEFNINIKYKKNDKIRLNNQVYEYKKLYYKDNRYILLTQDNKTFTSQECPENYLGHLDFIGD